MGSGCTGAETHLTVSFWASKARCSLRMTGGSSWSRRNSLELEVGEMLTGGFTVAFSTNAMQGIAVGSKGSVFRHERWGK